MREETRGVLMLTMFFCIRPSRALRTNTNTTIDESKLVLKFCTVNLCPGDMWCYCCMTEKPEPRCYATVELCKAACPACNPKCPSV
ncbi:hypothetical protein BS78_K003400 [Paspalum vaginatum]|uniref:Bowman-Birk serine protease inhibitors family domain-containing protein n=1 Tax=Paspalum vaginatum TaxID=158149 RepID=A0A9W7X9Q4_9POAL|nr:hypothetical protein BS78_K003400 [Paspalum vaginatum]